MISIIENETEKEIKKEIEKTLEVMQKKYQNDIYGFLDIIYRDHYIQWKYIKDDWNTVFRDAPTEVKVKFTFRRSGLIKQPSYSQ